jgi:hypothetical protein
MLLIVLPQPIHAVIVLRVAHDGVDVIGLLNGEFDDQPRPMHPIMMAASGQLLTERRGPEPPNSICERPLYREPPPK